jgi:hypothetical protein
VGVLGTAARDELEKVADLVVPDVAHLRATVEGSRLRVLGA